MIPFFSSPIGFLIAVLLLFLLVRFGTRLLNGYFGEGRRYDRDPRGGPRAVSLEVRIFRLAYKLRGRITVSDIVLETGLSMAEAEETINRMVDGIRVRMEVQDRGMVVYEFPEIIRRLEEP